MCVMQMQLCVVCTYVTVCVSADMFANQTRAAGPLHAVCLIVLPPSENTLPTFVCKHISIKLTAFCNHIVYACLSVCVWECMCTCFVWTEVFVHVSWHVWRRAMLALWIQRVLGEPLGWIRKVLVITRQCIRRQIIYHYASLCVLINNSD